MIDLMMKFGGDIILIRIEGRSVKFANSAFGMQFASIDGLKLSYNGVIKEFPDLKDTSDWREIAVTRFKDKIASMSNEDRVFDYVLLDLKKYGYVPMYKQKKGFRKEVIK